MFDSDAPDWRADAKWISGILLAILVAALVPLFSFSQLSSRERALPLLQSVLGLALLPPGGDALVPAVREGVAYEAGGELELLPGTGVSATAGELEEGLGVEAARGRIAASLAGDVVARGAPAVTERLAGSVLQEQFGRALAAVAQDLARSALLEEMMPSGLDNGSRLADWRLQAQQNPGAPVQPIVGVFVRLPVAELEPLSERQIGERVVEGLAAVLVEQGSAAAQELVTNPNLLARLASGTEIFETRLVELFETLLLSWDGMLADRLEQALAIEEASVGGNDVETLGVASRDELAGLDPESANRLVIARLAERAYEGGSAAVSQVVTDAGQRARLAGAGTVVDALSRDAHRDYSRWSWILGVASLLLLAVLAISSRAWGRLANPGIALALAAAGGSLLALRLAEVMPAAGSVAAPTTLRAQGAFGHLLQLLGYVAASLPADAMSLMVRNHLVLLVVGAALVVLSLLVRVFRRVRPRRRSLI